MRTDNISLNYSPRGPGEEGWARPTIRLGLCGRGGLLQVKLLHGITHQIPQHLLIRFRKHWAP